MYILNSSYDRRIEKAYIIGMPSDETSRNFSERAAASCIQIGQDHKKWEAVLYRDGQIIMPPQISEDNLTRFVRVTNRYLTGGEIACALSHISLWFHCLKIDRPLIILEHDAVMVKKLDMHNFFNCVHYLGNREYATGHNQIAPIPMYASDGKNNLFICRAHAYAIDPQVAKNLLSYVLQHGIVDPADFLIRADLFSIQHDGNIYAYDDPMNMTTIKNRNPVTAEGHRIAIPNDELKF